MNTVVISIESARRTLSFDMDMHRSALITTQYNCHVHITLLKYGRDFTKPDISIYQVDNGISLLWIIPWTTWQLAVCLSTNLDLAAVPRKIQQLSKSFNSEFWN